MYRTIKIYDFNKRKPKNGQIILVKEKEAYYPRLGEYVTNLGDSHKIFFPDHHEFLTLEYLDSWWIEIPDDIIIDTTKESEAKNNKINRNIF